MPSVLSLIVAVFFLSILPAQVHALTPGQVFDKVKDSVVVVKTLDSQGKVKGQGSGVLLPSGKIATNCHVVENGASYQVGRGKHLVPATLFAEDGDKDICLLNAKGITGKPAQLGKAAGLKVGDPVYSVGAPKGLELSLSDGIVAQLRGGPPPFIQTTAAISPGSSGGGLFDKEGTAGRPDHPLHGRWTEPELRHTGGMDRRGQAGPQNGSSRDAVKPNG